MKLKQEWDRDGIKESWIGQSKQTLIGRQLLQSLWVLMMECLSDCSCIKGDLVFLTLVGFGDIGVYE